MLRCYGSSTKIQQTKMLITCQRFGDWFLFELIWQYSSKHKTYNKSRFCLSYSLTFQLLHSIPSWLVLAEIKCTVHVAAAKQHRNSLNQFNNSKSEEIATRNRSEQVGFAEAAYSTV